MQRTIKSKLPSRPIAAKPYHLVRDRKGRRVILCAIGECIEVFSEIHAYNNHIVGWGTLAARWRISKRRNLEYQVRHTYRQWKGLEKESTLRRLSENLEDTLMGQYHLTEEQAIIQGCLNENIVDTSDDES
ncbi:hypothetical protein R1sor_002897 [Riccia sorocarpa]|uniref:HNH homing endonuclease n=1 Tax=Riccia sorocarpa TaxID=122646 RepID=A0ABD3H3A9_9MARC